ncbi:MAG: DoxX family protein [Planctomycetes bacterium]|nr:DoxX family protein [Planctomycetota bacterium]
MADGKKTGLDVGLLVLRLALGGIMIAHGAAKLFGPNAVGIAGFSDTLGKLGVPYPYPMAVATVSAEIGGGLLVVLGLFPRLGALAIAAVMGVAMWKVHLANGFFMVLKMDAPGEVPNGCEYNVALLGMALCILFAGAGALRVPVGKPST